MPAPQAFYDNGAGLFVALSVARRSWTDKAHKGGGLPRLNAPPICCGFPHFLHGVALFLCFVDVKASTCYMELQMILSRCQG